MKLALRLEEAIKAASDLALPSMTHDEFWAFCQRNPDMVVELSAEGKLVFMPLPKHLVTAEIQKLLLTWGIWNRALPQPGIIFGQSAGFTLPNGAVRSPDAAWIPAAKWNALTNAQKEKFSHICPDFVVELMSPSDRLKAAQSKMSEYMANGALLGWLIDRKTKQVHVYRPGQKTQVLINPTQVSGDPELPGFVLPLARIF